MKLRPYRDLLAFCATLVLVSVSRASDLEATLDGPLGFGTSVAFIGDWNGDGHEDFAVGARQSGMVRIVSGASLTPLWDAYIGPPSEWFGRAVADAKDVNQDGYSDLLVGGRGVVYVLSGEWISKTVAGQVPQSPYQLHRIVSSVPNDWFGETVLGGLDLNHDGYADFVVGAPGPGPGPLLSTGAVRAYSGQNGVLLWERLGSNAGDVVGSALGRLAPKNQFDSDTTEEIVVGASGLAVGASGQERVLVLSGSTGALLETIQPPQFTEDPNLFGAAIAVVGDVNGDQEDDFVIGAPSFSQQPGHIGALFFFVSGQNPIAIVSTTNNGIGNKLAAAGDINGDAIPDFVAGCSMTQPVICTGINGATIDTIDTPAPYVANSLAVGDIDNDGWNEIVSTRVSLAQAYIWDTANLFPPTALESAWIIQTPAFPVTRVNTLFSTYGLEGLTVRVEVEYEHGGGMPSTTSYTMVVPGNAPPQLSALTYIAHTHPFSGDIVYAYRTRVYEVGSSPPGWTGIATGHSSVDFNLDNTVDIIDLGYFGSALGKSLGQPGFNPLCDYNISGIVDVVDLGIWIAWRDVINAQ